MHKRHSSGPGSSTKGGVSSTMAAPFSGSPSKRTGVGGGRYGSIASPFDKPQDTGGGGIPTKMMDGMPVKVATRVTAGQVSPGMKVGQSIGTRRYAKK